MGEIIGAMIGGIFVVIAAMITLYLRSLRDSIRDFRKQVADDRKEMRTMIDGLASRTCPYPGGCPIMKQDEARRSDPNGK